MAPWCFLDLPQIGFCMCCASKVSVGLVFCRCHRMLCRGGVTNQQEIIPVTLIIYACLKDYTKRIQWPVWRTQSEECASCTCTCVRACGHVCMHVCACSCWSDLSASLRMSVMTFSRGTHNQRCRSSGWQNDAIQPHSDCSLKLANLGVCSSPKQLNLQRTHLTCVVLGLGQYPITVVIIYNVLWYLLPCLRRSTIRIIFILRPAWDLERGGRLHVEGQWCYITRFASVPCAPVLLSLPHSFFLFTAPLSTLETWTFEKWSTPYNFTF